jgi:hypothetical protein
MTIYHETNKKRRNVGVLLTWKEIEYTKEIRKRLIKNLPAKVVAQQIENSKNTTIPKTNGCFLCDHMYPAYLDIHSPCL